MLACVYAFWLRSRLPACCCSLRAAGRQASRLSAKEVTPGPPRLRSHKHILLEGVCLSSVCFTAHRAQAHEIWDPRLATWGTLQRCFRLLYFLVWLQPIACIGYMLAHLPATQYNFMAMGSTRFCMCLLSNHGCMHALGGPLLGFPSNCCLPCCSLQ